MENAANLEGKGRVGLALVAVLAAIALSRGKEAAAAIKLPETVAQAEALTAAQAEVLLASPADLLAANQAFVAAHPTAYSMIEQANALISAGLASAGDILRFEVDKAYFAKYVAEGGTASYEDFTSYTEHWTAEYREAKQEVKDKDTQHQVDGIVEGYLETDGYGNVTGLDEEGITRFLEILTPGGAIYEELASRYPELVPVGDEPWEDVPPEPVPPPWEDVPWEDVPWDQAPDWDNWHDYWQDNPPWADHWDNWTDSPWEDAPPWDQAPDWDNWHDYWQDVPAWSDNWDNSWDNWSDGWNDYR